MYVDHILYPTITDSAFLTEVHHITGAGKEGGVVYAEMEAREHTPDDLLTHGIHKALYPGRCGYSSETGGLIADLRVLQADTIRSYHSATYRPDNLSLVICGLVGKAELFTTLDAVEANIVSKGPLPPLKRPWSDPVPPFTEAVEQKLLYPSEDEEQGRVYLGWRCTPWQDFYSRTALNILWTYLTSTSLSPIHRQMIEIDRPYAGDVDTSVLERSQGIHWIEFDDVDLDRIDEVKERLFDVLRALVARKDVEMERMRSLIRKEIRQSIAEWEDQPHEAIVGYCISNFLYGEEKWKGEEKKEEGGSGGGGKGDGRGDLEREMRVEERLSALLEEDQDFWLGLIQRWILDPPYALIVGLPSRAESHRLMEEEEARVTAQISALKAKDPDALLHLEKRLQAAIQRNASPPPEALLASFPSPDLTRVPQHRIFTARTGKAPPGLKAQNDLHPAAKSLDDFLAHQPPLSSLPIVAQFDHIPSQFVQLRALLSTAGLSREQKELLPLFRDLMFESPVQRRDGALLSSEQVVTALEDQLVHYSNASGLSSDRFTVGSYGQYLTVALKVEAAQYSVGLRWLFDLLHGVQFTRERMSVSVKRMLASIPEMKNDGGSVVKAASSHVNFVEESMQHAVNFMRQQTLLKRILKDLRSTDPSAAERWLERLKAIQAALTVPEGLLLHVACDFLMQDRLLSALLEHTGKAEGEVITGGQGGQLWDKGGHLRFSSSLSRPLTADSIGQAELHLIGVKACRSSYLSTTTPLPSTFSYSHPQLPAIRLTLEYLTALEGPMWRRIRGMGYSYSYAIRLDVETGLLSFVLFKSTNVVGGYEESAAIVREFAEGGSAMWKDGDLRAAKSSLGFELLSSGDTLIAAADQSLYDWLKGEEPGYHQRLLQRVQGVEAGDMEAAMRQWVVPLFDGQRSRVCLVTNPTQADDLTDFFERKSGGRTVHVVHHLKEWFEGGGEEEGEEADEEEEEEEGDDDDDGEDDEDGDEDDEDDEDD